MIDDSHKLMHFTEKESLCVMLSLASSVKRRQHFCIREMLNKHTSNLQDKGRYCRRKGGRAQTPTTPTQIYLSFHLLSSIVSMCVVGATLFSPIVQT